MDEALVARLVHRRFRRATAVLQGYRKIAPEDGYTYIVPDATGRVEGLVLRDVDMAALRAFDRYEDEGRLYRRVEVAVTVNETLQSCLAYVGIPEAFEPS